MKYFVVKLTLLLGGYEKSAIHLVEAEDDQSAGKLAIEGECHGDPEWTDEDYDECWDCHEFVYRVYNIKPITEAEYYQLKKGLDL